MSTQRLQIPLPLMLNADSYCEWNAENHEDGSYTWYVRIMFGDTEIGRVKYSDKISDKPSENDIARCAADWMRPIIFPSS